MFERRVFAMLAIGIVVAGGLAGCEKMKSMLGMGGGGTADFRNAQIDVTDTPCSDNSKFSTLVLQDGKYVLGNYQFEMFGDTKRGDVTGHTQTGSPESSVFVGNCAIDGQTSQVMFVYGNDANGKFSRLGATNLTDNGNGLVQSFDIANSEILVEQNQGNPPKLTKTEYALLNGKLTNLSPNATAPSGTDADLDNVSFQVFHDKLQPYGTWVNHKRWGEAWRPNNQAGFRPYENGHWENSDEYGATWVSNDPWGDTPTHYGRWGYDPSYGGWLWVPGYVWGPGWVTWRTSDEYVGWFPIPPGEWDGEGAYVDNWDGWYGYRGALDEAAFFGLWSFVAPGDIFVGDVRGRIIDRRGYGRFMGRTRGWSRFGVEHGHIVNRAFDRGRFHEAFHRDLPGSRHDFAGRHVTSVAAGHRIEGHERVGHGGEGVHGGFHTAGFHGGGGAGHGAAGGFGRGGTARSGGFGHSSGGFSRSGNGIGHSGGGFARSGGGGAGGFGRSGGGGGGAGGFARSGGGGGGNGFGHSGGGGNGFGHSNGGGGNAFGHAGGGGGMGGFGQHSGGGGFGGGHSAPQVPHSGGGGGNNHHH